VVGAIHHRVDTVCCQSADVAYTRAADDAGRRHGRARHWQNVVIGCAAERRGWSPRIDTERRLAGRRDGRGSWSIWGMRGGGSDRSRSIEHGSRSDSAVLLLKGASADTTSHGGGITSAQLFSRSIAAGCRKKRNASRTAAAGRSFDITERAQRSW